MEQLSSTIDTHKWIYECCNFFYGLLHLWGLSLPDRNLETSVRIHFHLWEISWRIHGRSQCALGHLENVLVLHTSSFNFYRQTGTSDLHYFSRTKNLEKSFGDVKSQICELSEILGPRTPEIICLKLMEYGDFTWRSISLLSEKAERIITDRVYVFSDSILWQDEVIQVQQTKLGGRKSYFDRQNF